MKKVSLLIYLSILTIAEIDHECDACSELLLRTNFSLALNQ